MSINDLSIFHSNAILTDLNGFAVEINVRGEATIAGFYNSYKGEVETGTGIPQIIQMASVSFDRSALELNLTSLPKKGDKISLTYIGNFLKYRITEVDEDKTFNLVNLMLAVDNG